MSIDAAAATAKTASSSIAVSGLSLQSVCPSPIAPMSARSILNAKNRTKQPTPPDDPQQPVVRCLTLLHDDGSMNSPTPPPG